MPPRPNSRSTGYGPSVEGSADIVREYYATPQAAHHRALPPVTVSRIHSEPPRIVPSRRLPMRTIHRLLFALVVISASFHVQAQTSAAPSGTAYSSLRAEVTGS